jgi:hypothetical protein
MTTPPIRLSPSGPVITNAGGAPLTFGEGSRVRLVELVSPMSGTKAVPECPHVICPDGFSEDDALTLTLTAPNSQYKYRANLSLDLVSRATAAGGVVVLYLDTSVDGGSTFTTRAKNSHQIGTGIDSIHPANAAEGRQAQVWLPLTAGQALGVDSSGATPTTTIKMRARAQLISGTVGIVEVFSNASEAGDGFGDCSEKVTELNGTIHMELEECL